MGLAVSISGWIRWLGCGALLIAVGRAQDVDVGAAGAFPRQISTTLELQVELHRRGFSCGAIDDVAGPQTTAALRAFQRRFSLGESGVLDRATREILLLNGAAITEYVVAEADLVDLRPLPATWLEKSQQPALGFATVLERVGERHRASPRLLQRLNAGLDWTTLAAGTAIKVPAVTRPAIEGQLARIVIRLEARELELEDDGGRVLAHFPVSIARMVEKRPLGELRVIVAIPEPNYTFDPAVFPESAEARELGRKLIIPPGPNNPVGRVWIGLNRSGYGIHGTPDPEKVGRTESHGCFRLANWDAVALLKLAWVGMVVMVEP